MASSGGSHREVSWIMSLKAMDETSTREDLPLGALQLDGFIDELQKFFFTDWTDSVRSSWKEACNRYPATFWDARLILRRELEKSGAPAQVCTEKPECPICVQEMSSPPLSLTPCGHVLHEACLSSALSSWKRECPSCRAPLSQQNVFRLATLPAPAPDRDFAGIPLDALADRHLANFFACGAACLQLHVMTQRTAAERQRSQLKGAENLLEEVGQNLHSLRAAGAAASAEVSEARQRLVAELEALESWIEDSKREQRQRKLAISLRAKHLVAVRIRALVERDRQPALTARHEELAELVGLTSSNIRAYKAATKEQHSKKRALDLELRQTRVGADREVHSAIASAPSTCSDAQRADSLPTGKAAVGEAARRSRGRTLSELVRSASSAHVHTQLAVGPPATGAGAVATGAMASDASDEAVRRSRGRALSDMLPPPPPTTALLSGPSYDKPSFRVKPRLQQAALTRFFS